MQLHYRLDLLNSFPLHMQYLSVEMEIRSINPKLPHVPLLPHPQ